MLTYGCTLGYAVGETLSDHLFGDRPGRSNPMGLPAWNDYRIRFDSETGLQVDDEVCKEMVVNLFKMLLQKLKETKDE